MQNSLRDRVATFIFLVFIANSFLRCENVTHENVVQDFDEINQKHEVLDTLLEYRSTNQITESDTIAQKLIALGLVDVQSVNSNIIVDIKYSTTDNFMGENLYGDLKQAFLQPDIAARLGRVQEFLESKDSLLRLYVWDAVRPRNIQQKMWDALDSIPVSQRGKFLSNPKNGSLHNYAAAVDLSIFDLRTDTLLDMGAGFDDMRKIAYPELEAHFLATGELTQAQVNNRKLLREVMRSENFYNIPSEWWHFNACSRERAKLKYDIIE
ncbi:MAG: M15 family metallopeptidase [Crocinitomicaceae bacterium]|nr:M15 family metallopeptidase [Crocinitomicaceae bacterium]